MTQERPATGPRTLAESAGLIWPAPARVAVVDRVPATAADETMTAYALLPDAVDPRMAVPLRPLALLPPWLAARRRPHRPGPPCAAGWWRWRSGPASPALLLRGRLVVTQADGAGDGLDDLLAELLGEPVCVGIRVGTAAGQPQAGAAGGLPRGRAARVRQARDRTADRPAGAGRVARR